MICLVCLGLRPGLAWFVFCLVCVGLGAWLCLLCLGLRPGFAWFVCFVWAWGPGFTWFVWFVWVCGLDLPDFFGLSGPGLACFVWFVWFAWAGTRGLPRTPCAPPQRVPQNPLESFANFTKWTQLLCARRDPTRGAPARRESPMRVRVCVCVCFARMFVWPCKFLEPQGSPKGNQNGDQTVLNRAHTSTWKKNAFETLCGPSWIHLRTCWDPSRSLQSYNYVCFCMFWCNKRVFDEDKACMRVWDRTWVAKGSEMTSKIILGVED